MAVSEILGLFQTPDQYSAAQDAAMQRQFLQRATLDPFQKASVLGQQAGYSAAQGIGGALGGKDPQLEMISRRNVLLGQLNPSDPSSYIKAAEVAAKMGDSQFAVLIAQEGRKAQSEVALTAQRNAAASRETRQATPNDIQIANELATLQDTLDQLKNQPASPDRDRAMNLLTTRFTELTRLSTKPEKDLRYGTDRESISAELYDKSFSQLTTAERAIVNKRVEDEQGKKAEKGAAKLTNVMPGQKEFADIPKFRADIQKTIAPQIQSVTAADQALQAINDSITTNNFVSFNAARVQLAKALGDSQLSRRDVEQAGGDPSLFGKLTDTTSTLFTGTPTLETQNLIKNTLSAIKKVSTDKANREIDVQRNIAYSTPGYDKTRVDAALRFPEFEATTAAPISGDVAAQARAILEQRKKASK
jgi:hypothetical protein